MADFSFVQTTGGELGSACEQSSWFLDQHITVADLPDTRSLLCDAGEIETAIHDDESCIFNSVDYAASKPDHDSQVCSIVKTDDGSELIDVAKNSCDHDPVGATSASELRDANELTPLQLYRQSKKTQFSTDPELASYEGEGALTVQKSIKDVQELYTFGVRVGFLRRDERVRLYLENMRAKYEYISSLRDNNGEQETVLLGKVIEHANSV